MDYIRKGKWDIMGVELINWLEQERKKIEAAAEAKIAAAEARIDEANARIAAAEARAYERFAKAMLEAVGGLSDSLSENRWSWTGKSVRTSEVDGTERVQEVLDGQYSGGRVEYHGDRAGKLARAGDPGEREKDHG